MRRAQPFLLLAAAAIFPFCLLAQQQQQQEQAPAAETVVRTMPFTHAGGAQQMQELATILRSCVELREVSADAARRVITVRGKANQTELAAWLLGELDLPAADTPPMPVRERRAAAEADDFIRVLTLARGVTAHRLQEVATVVRAVSGLRRVFTYNQRGAIVLRGTADELKMAEWLTAAFDRPDTPVREVLTYESAGANDRVRVFYLRPDLPAQSQQELATIARAVADIRSVFTVSRPVAIVARASVTQIAMAEWLIRELDPSQQHRSSPPVTAQAAARPPSAPYRCEPPDDTLRVFYLGQGESMARLQETAVRVRQLAAIRRVFTYNAERAIALRGAAGQIAEAEELIRSRPR